MEKKICSLQCNKIYSGICDGVHSHFLMIRCDMKSLKFKISFKVTK